MITGQDLIDKGYIPFDKSWIIRMVVLDLLAQYNGREYVDGLKWLGTHYHELNNDSQVAHDAGIEWNDGDTVHVGESGALYRNLWFASEKLYENGTLNAKKELVRSGTLVARELGDTPDRLQMSFEELLALDTTQWVTAYLLFNYSFSGNMTERVCRTDPKIELTFDAIEHWNRARNSGNMWKPRYDEVILRQCLSYLQWLKDGTMHYDVRIREEYPYGRAFEKIAAAEAGKWPGLRKHESDRLVEMEQQLATDRVTSKDHRVVQAVAMLKRDGILKGLVDIEYKSVVNKSWQQFWEFIEDAYYLSQF